MYKKRIQEIMPGLNPSLKKIEDQILLERGKISPLYRTLLNSEPIAIGWESLITAIRNKSSLPNSMIELMILRVAHLNKSNYEFEAHLIPARKAGLTDEQITLLKSNNYLDNFTSVENILIQAADFLTLEVELPDSLFEKLSQHFNDKEILEIVTTISAYNMVSRFLKALQISY